LAALVPIGESIFGREIIALGILQLAVLGQAERVYWMQTFRSEQTTLRSLLEEAAAVLSQYFVTNRVCHCQS
jgi:hypothetical protein